MRQISLMCLGVLLGTAAPGVAGALVVIPHAGHLRDAADQPVQGTVPMQFRLFDGPALGVAAWEASCAVDLRGGFYSVRLGEGTCAGASSIPAFGSSSTRWLEVSVGGIALAPRLQLGAVPLAEQALSAADAAQFGGAPPSAYVRKTELESVGAVTLNPANLGAGRIPDANLQGMYSGALTFSNASNVFVGNGAGLTGVNAAMLGGAVSTAYAKVADLAVGGAVSINPANLGAGRIPDANLQGTYSGPVSFTNAANVLAGRGEALTGVNAATLGGFPASDYLRVGGGSSGNVTISGNLTVTGTVSASNLTGTKVDVTASAPVSCNSSSSGRLYFHPATRELKVCDGTAWVGVASGVPRSCKAIRTSGVATSGTYLVDLDGDGPLSSMTVYCDMATDGGGWTVITGLSGGDGEMGIASDHGAMSGNPLSFQYYNWTAANKMALASISAESLFVRSDGSWIKAARAMFDTGLGTPSSHAEWSTTLTASNGSTAGGYIGYSNYNISGGGDFGLTDGGSFDHHGSSYWHLNTSCVRHYLYSYSNASQDGDQSYKVNTGLGSWGATATCSSSEGGGLALYAAMR